MDIGIVSVRYAKALLKFAVENREEEQVYLEMETLASSFQSVPALQSALLNPVFAASQKVKLLETACAGSKTLSVSTLRFLRLVIEKKRAELMMFIANSYVTLYRKSKQIIKGRLIVPVKIKEEVSQRLRHIIESKTNTQMEFEVCVDKEIEGGFILEYDTYRLDASLRTQLSVLHRTLKG